MGSYEGLVQQPCKNGKYVNSSVFCFSKSWNKQPKINIHAKISYMHLIKMTPTDICHLDNCVLDSFWVPQRNK